ncbi:transposase, partial [Escherichia coli]|nr:transposase [Escherichia coli]
RPVKTGELIGMDAIELRMGELRRYVITMIDECSNYALALAVPSLNSDIVKHFFSRAARLFPVGISQIITDNGKEFLGNFDKTLQEAAIKHLWTYPYTPKMNAICERFNRTLREQFIEFNEILLFEDLALFNQKLAEYLVLYNSKRPHKALALMTPFKREQKLQYVVDPYKFQLKRKLDEDEVGQRLLSIPCVGTLTASTISTEIGDGKQYASSRDFAAATGLVPRQYSTGGRTTLLGISKRGNKKIRTLLVQCARVFIQKLEHQSGRLADWVRELLCRKSNFVVTCALANKLARIAWALTTRQQTYEA